VEQGTWKEGTSKNKEMPGAWRTKKKIILFEIEQRGKGLAPSLSSYSARPSKKLFIDDFYIGLSAANWEKREGRRMRS
jgi:hypothetical protein